MGLLLWWLEFESLCLTLDSLSDHAGKSLAERVTGGGVGLGLYNKCRDPALTEDNGQKYTNVTVPLAASNQCRLQCFVPEYRHGVSERALPV